MQYILNGRISSLKYQRSMALGCKDKEIRKSDFWQKHNFKILGFPKSNIVEISLLNFHEHVNHLGTFDMLNSRLRFNILINKALSKCLSLGNAITCQPSTHFQHA